ncbi:MAG: thermonuclease family protein [Leisingera sp.]
MSRVLSLAALLGLALILNWLKPGAGAGEMEFLPASRICVIDGDTIAQGKDRYRLKGFDTPETRNARCESERARGYAAKERLLEIVRQNGGLDLVLDSRRDKYGRFLAEAYAGGLPVRDFLITEGLARPYAGGKRKSWCR